MNMNRRCTLSVIAVVMLWMGRTAAGQTPEVAKEFWPAVKTVIEVRPKTRLELSAMKESGEDLARVQWKFSVMGSYRMKRLVKAHLGDIDDEKNYVMVLGVGYEYLRTDDNGSTKTENRIFIQAVPHYLIPRPGLLLQDRSRVEFRWINNIYSTRYRNKLTVERPLNLDSFRFTPYASGELFYDGQHRSWNQNRYAFGVVFPYKKLLSLDTYFLRQNCTTCKEEHVNVFGVTLTLFLGGKKK